MLNDLFETREKILAGKDATLFVTCETWDVTMYHWDPQGRPGDRAGFSKRERGAAEVTGHYATAFVTCETCVTC